ncbi:MAG: acyl carrier protein [Bacteroidota bacterium]
MEEIKSKVQTIFQKVFEAPALEIHEALTAKDVEKWDSITHLAMIAKVEETFGIRFKLKELIKMNNVGDLLTMVKLKTEEQK